MSGWLNNYLNHSDLKTASTMFFLSFIALVSLVFLPFRTILPAALLIACASGLINGTNTIIMATIPLRCSKYGKSSSVAGVLNFCSYFGVGVSSLALGALMSYGNIEIIPLSWLLAASLGIMFMLIALKSNPLRITAVANKFHP